jgi:hypothetical protein
MFFTSGRLAGNQTGNLMKESLGIYKICRRKDLQAHFRIFPRNLAPDFPQYISGKEFEKMKTFIVYDLDSQMPVAVGEQVSAETARYCASVATGIFEANLLAEEIDLEKQITY